MEALNLVPYTKFTYQAYMVGMNKEVTFDALGLYNESGESVDHTCLSVGAHGKKISGNLTVINADDKGVCC